MNHQEEILRIAEKIKDATDGEYAVHAIEALIMTTATLNKSSIPVEHQHILFDSMKEIQEKLFSGNDE